jgi:transposase
MTTEERRRRRFTVELRKEQVLLIETGQRTIVEVSRLFEIRPANVRYWMRKYGSKPLPEKIIVSNGKELDRLKDLETQIKTLREVIANQQVELYYQKAVIGLAKERIGEDFEKK